MPGYTRAFQQGRHYREVVPEFTFNLGPFRPRVSIVETELPGCDVPVWLVRCAPLYDRHNVYDTQGDEHLRFAVLNFAALHACQRLRFAPDIVHVNDWHAALVPLLLRSLFKWDKLFQHTRTVFTIHNLGHQGTFDAKLLPQLGLEQAKDLVHQDELNAGRFSFLLSGLLHANALTTVSPTYAREIQTPEQGVGLDGFLRARTDVLFGILNGIDEHEWNPEEDPHLKHHFSVRDLSGKERNKAQLLQTVGLPYLRHVPVMAMVSRLVWQKGFDLCERVLPRILERRKVQLVVLGQGEQRYRDFFKALSKHFPQQVAFQPRFSEGYAHLFEAGSDIFLMPSRYEPCGLNQMYSLKYGTVPVVHKTGGLADTVRQYDARTHKGTGFVFDHFDEAGLTWGIERALATWGSGTGHDRAHWAELQRNGMQQRSSWAERTPMYEKLYRLLRPELHG
jgi:starch synthase